MKLKEIKDMLLFVWWGVSKTPPPCLILMPVGIHNGTNKAKYLEIKNLSKELTQKGGEWYNL